MTMQGSYANLVFIKTRKVAQMHIEFPLEYAEKLVSIFGAPNPEAEIPVVVARMKAGSFKGRTPDFESGNAGSTPAPKEHWNEMKLAKQAGIRCGEEDFIIWVCNACGFSSVNKWNTADSARAVRQLCLVTSRAELDTNSEAGKRWQALNLEYEQATGRAARE